MDFNKVTKVIYHKNCNDGLSSAGIFYSVKPDIDYISYAHGSNTHNEWEFKNECLLILDLSLSKDIIEELIKNNIIYIVDHHLPTEMLIDVIVKPNQIHYDKSKCGALLLWNLIYPNIEQPNILQYVNDRDLWLNKMDNYQEVFEALALEESTVENWNKIIFKNTSEKYLEDGKVLIKMKESNLKLLETKSYIKEYINNDDDKIYSVIYCNSPSLQSDIGNRLLLTHPKADFAAIYYYSGDIDKTIFSVRGIDKVNLSLIAKKFGGGGHFNAAGFIRNGLNPHL